MRRILICTGVLGGGTALVFALAALTATLFPHGTVVQGQWGPWGGRVGPLGGIVPAGGGVRVSVDDMTVGPAPLEVPMPVESGVTVEVP